MTVDADFLIAPAVGADLPAVVALLDDAQLPAAGIEQHFPDAFFVARGDGGVVGAAGVEVYGGVGLLRSVVVAEAARGTGLGERLSRAVMELAAERGVRELYLLTTSADGYFPRLGFVRVAREDLPGELDRSEQMRGACPVSAIAMRRVLEPAESGFLPRV